VEYLNLEPHFFESAVIILSLEVKRENTEWYASNKDSPSVDTDIISVALVGAAAIGAAAVIADLVRLDTEAMYII
jgi:hypothetical protein